MPTKEQRLKRDIEKTTQENHNHFAILQRQIDLLIKYITTGPD